YLKYYSVVTMLLIGVALNFFFSSFILILQYFNDFSQSFQVVRWLMGGLEIVGFEPIFYLLPIVLGVSLIVFFKASELDLLSLGDEFALSRGLSVERERIFLIAMVALVVGFIVAFSGPIGFVGMMMPHICRMLLGVPHRRLVPVVFMLAGAFLVACDSFARIVAAPAEIPVGVITALLGGPFFLWIIISQNRSVSR
ncbi:MAG: iron ABC transporter permease, partial [Bdellovibrionales bacterium]|nr:iron ABC transporter permease [Bdellovibrionales bacterium]